MTETKKNNYVKAVSLILLALLAASVLLPLSASATGSGRVVRVGWYESPFNKTDEYGRRTGYAYDYQQKVASYTGWTYEYVNGSWPELLQMLIDGKIDLLSDVSYTEERSNEMLFSSLPMGMEEYYLFIDYKNSEISIDDPGTLNGKTIGINKDSVQVGFFREWARSNGVSANINELTGSVDDSLAMLRSGRIDGYVALNSYLNVEEALPLCKVGESEFYFAVSKDRTDILKELNPAMENIYIKNPYYNRQLHEKYLTVSGANLLLSTDEESWLSEHGTIRVGFQDNYLAFCAKDPETGELTGALKDYLRVAADCLENAHIDFEAYVYPTAAAAMEALKKGEVDCMFPANLTDYDGEVQGYFMTSPIMRTDISAIILESEEKSFHEKEHVTVAVNAGNPNYNMFLLDNFPEWRSIFFKNTAECLNAIANKKADCLLISNYRYNNIASLCKKYGLISTSTGVAMDYCFAVKRGDTTLLSILNKIAEVVPESTVNASLSYYFTEDAKLSFGDLVSQNIGLIAAILSAFVLIIIVILLFNARSRKKANESQRIINATETDPLTGLYTKTYFYEYSAHMYRDDPDTPMDAVVLNIEQFHSVNAIHGWAFGDHVLRELGREIDGFVKEQGGIAGHSESDRFAIYCRHMENYQELFDRLQGKLNVLSPNAGIWLRMGVMPWEKGIEPEQLIEQALIACSLARGLYKEHMVIFDKRVRDRENYERRLKNDMHSGISNREFKVYYQPKYDIVSDPPKLMSAEALVRWEHPEFGMIPPSDFVPLFERSGLIYEVDKYVWGEAAAQIARWRSQYGVTIPISVNLSRMDIFDGTLEATLDGLIEKYGIERTSLKLEVTESAYTEDADDVVRVVEKLRKKGYEFELDDFGTGYSTLNMLSSLPISTLKMDRSFIKNIDQSEKEIQLVEVILNIAKKLGIHMIAEGVETESQLQILKKLGCESVQGFYFSRPLPVTEFESSIIKPKE